jgi:hypothetical protein
MAQKPCSDDANKASATKAKNDYPGRHYGPVWVKVEGVHEDNVTVTAPGPNGKSVTATLIWNDDQVWADCPSLLDASRKKTPSPEAEGILYIEENTLKTNNIVGDPKWPDRLAGRGAYRSLEVWPISLTLTCAELRTGKMLQATLELLDSNTAAPEQQIPLRYAPLELKLTQTAFREFPVQFPMIEHLEAAVATIRGTASAANANSGGATTPDARSLALAWSEVAAWQDEIKRTPAIKSGGNDQPTPPDSVLVRAKRLLDDLFSGR